MAGRRAPRVGTPPGTRRSTRRWRQVAAAYKQDCRRRDAPCHICRQPIHYDAPPQTPWAFETDHIKPVQSHPHLAMQPSNLAPAHVRCNRARQSTPQQDWIRPAW
ncbi:HNH endonuclease signature motif containing protein [Mycobacterium paraseoulense]|uniref:HNH domain-containing protein n=1 Tax=Mycobacterium paraseoulense TaxID=590652 RepID=A0A1X0IAM6_9MYCO|nr:HNH endonuclease [Mycobacterium paraseoulense]MCV7394377.1 HNH endonuclease [Mycobacterium paraseoulense]ORB40263.1 hypothetical protein BST39_14330 [Mycobacterium paraseoulense]